MFKLSRLARFTPRWSRSFTTQVNKLFQKHPEEKIRTPIPSAVDRATGAERDELLYPNEVWKHSPGIYGTELEVNMGTWDKPIVVETVFEERVVGCVGGCAEGIDEGFRYWTMAANTRAVCGECGNVFWLVKKNAETGELDLDYQAPNGHYNPANMEEEVEVTEEEYQKLKSEGLLTGNNTLELTYEQKDADQDPILTYKSTQESKVLSDKIDEVLKEPEAVEVMKTIRKELSKEEFQRLVSELQQKLPAEEFQKLAKAGQIEKYIIERLFKDSLERLVCDEAFDYIEQK